MNRRAANAKTTLLQRGPRSHLVMIKELTRCRSKLGGNAASVRKRKFDSVRSRGSAHIGGRFPRRWPRLGHGARPRTAHARVDKGIDSSLANWKVRTNPFPERLLALFAQRHGTARCWALPAQERRPIIVEIAKVSGNVDRTHFDLL